VLRIQIEVRLQTYHGDTALPVATATAATTATAGVEAAETSTATTTGVEAAKTSAAAAGE
jgi:hypothetical protein